MAVVVLVCCLNQGLKLGDVVGVREVDHVKGDVVLSEFLAQLLVLGDVFLERVSTEDDDTGLGIFVHSVLKRKLSDLDCSHKVTLSVWKQLNKFLVNSMLVFQEIFSSLTDGNIGDCSENVTDLTALSDM